MTVKRTRQKSGTIVTVEEFLTLDRPKGDLLLEIDRQRVKLTSLDRVYWPEEKLTKFDLLCFYLKVADHIMPYLKDRPAILQRWPRGINAPMFFQQDLDSAPEFIKTVRLTNQEGRDLDYGVFTTVASLLSNTRGTRRLNIWTSRTGSRLISIRRRRRGKTCCRWR
jgi:bifunctional non-homologous end joining protein LigD